MAGSADDNVRVVREFLEAVFRGGEFRGDLAVEDIVWHFAGDSPVGGEYRGHDGVARFFSAMIDRLGAPGVDRPGVEHALELHDMLASDEHVVVLWRRTGKAGGATLDTPGVGVYHVRDGKISEVWVLHWDQQAADAFFAAA